MAASGILMDKIEQPVHRICEEGCCNLINFNVNLDRINSLVLRAWAVIVILSHGSLDCLAQIQVMYGGMSRGVPGTIPVCIPNFKFPTNFYYDKILPKFFTECAQEVAEQIKAFFKTIAVNLAVHASDQEITTQANQVLQRIPKSENVCVNSTESLDT